MHRQTLALLLLPALWSCTPAEYRADADEQVYGILTDASAAVTGTPKTFSVERPVDTLRHRLETAPAPVHLSLVQALDVAAENSRDFQRQKESLYLAGLALTREQWQFSFRYAASSSPEVSGTNDDKVSAALRNSVSTTRNTVWGGALVAGFVNTFLKDLVNGGSWNGASVLSMTFTQPLLQGFGRRIAREPLTQAERDVIYAMRSYERFRATFAVQVVSNYYRVLEQIDNLEAEQTNLQGTVRNRERVEALVEAGRLAGVDLDRAKQQEFDAEDRLNSAQSRLQSAMDSFKLLLGLPTESEVQLDVIELARLRERGVSEVDLDEETAMLLGLARRYDYRTTVDRVADAARGVLVAQDALQSVLDFTAAIDVPSDPGQPLSIDWSKVNWSAGFDLQLAIDRLPERNVYRSALISLDQAIRSREEAADNVKFDVREALRNIRRTIESHRIQTLSLELSKRRLERADEFLQAGRGNTLDLLDAQTGLLQARLSLTGALVDYAIARLQLLRDLEGLGLEPKGLRYDPALKVPSGPLEPYGPEPPDIDLMEATAAAPAASRTTKHDSTSASDAAAVVSHHGAS